MYLTLRKSNTLICFENQWYVQWRLGFRNIYAIFIVTFSRAKFFVLPVCVKTDMLSKDINLLFMQIGWNVFHKKTKKECALWLHKILEEFYIFYHERSFLGPSKNDWQIFYSFGNLCVVRWYEKQKDRRLKQMRQRIIFEIWDRPHVQYDQLRSPLTWNI